MIAPKITTPCGVFSKLELVIARNLLDGQRPRLLRGISVAQIALIRRLVLEREAAIHEQFELDID